MAIIDGVNVSGTVYGLRDNDTSGGIASTFSTSTAYTAGQYVWYDSGSGAKLYRFTVDHAAGAWTGTDATEVKLGNDVSTLKSAINGDTVDISSSFTFTNNKVINATNGSYNTLTGDTYKANQGFVKVEGYHILRITMPQWSGSSKPDYGLAFYSAANKDSFDSGVKFPSGESYTPVEIDIPIPPTAKYVRTTYWATTNITFSCKKIIVGTNGRVDALETNVSSLTDDVTALGNSVDATEADIEALAETIESGMASATLGGWQNGSFNTLDGNNYDGAKNFIRNQTKSGVPSGTVKITCDSGYKFLLFAWDTNGNYIGSRKTGDVFDTTTTGYLLTMEYDCAIHADYLYKVALCLDPASSSITTADGAHCYFHSYTDDTLSKAGKAADAKVTGDALTALENALYVDETVDLATKNTSRYNISPSQNKWLVDNGYSTYTLMIPAGAKSVTIRANASRETYYALLKTDNRTLNAIPDYVSGETARLTINADESITITLPSDAHYIWITDTIQSVDRKPQSIVYKVNGAKQTTEYVFTGKKLAACGHSFTQGTHLLDRTQAWPYIVGRQLQMSSVQNVAVGGSTIAKQEGSYEEIFFSLDDFNAAEKDISKLYLVKDDPSDWHPFMLYQYANDAWGPKYNSHSAINGARSPIVDVAKSIDADADVIIIGAGANDWQYSWTPFGTMEDRGENATPYTFYGALHMLLRYFMDTYKSKGIPVFFTDAVVRKASAHAYEQNSIGKTYWDYKNAIIEVCEYYGYPFIDCGFNTGIPLYSIGGSTWYADEGSHLSAKGHERVGMFIAGKLAYYMV